MSSRIRGQEAEVIFILDGVPQANITAVRSWTLNFQLEILDEGYIGETTNRKDSIYNGVSGTIEIHVESDAIYSLISNVVDKARRRTPGLRVNLQFIQNLPNGQRQRHIVRDAELGEIPLNFGSRSDYGTVSIPFAGSDFSTV